MKSNKFKPNNISTYIGKWIKNNVKSTKIKVHSTKQKKKKI